MTNQNELTTVNTETGELVQHKPLNTGEVIVQETPEYTVVKLENGKYRKDMKYKQYFTNTPTNKDEKIELYKILNTQDEKLVTPMSKLVGEEIEIHHVYTQPYTSFDEETGGNTNGVTTTIYTGSNYIATSSKSIYYTIMGLFEVFGDPTLEDYKPIKVKITGTRLQNGTQINFELVSA